MSRNGQVLTEMPSVISLYYKPVAQFTHELRLLQSAQP
jgi:hypothetical protein